jgi:pimeloyl-ACP methyl ester carboxylesterase
MEIMLPIVLVPGLLCSAEVFAPQIVALWPYGPITVASTLSGNSIPEIATAILANAPPRFALVGISMGGHITLEIMRQAPERVMKLALLSTSARPDTEEQTAQRRAMIVQARTGNFSALIERLILAILHPMRQNDADLRDIIARMCHTVGVDGFVRQQEALIARADSRPSLAVIRVPTMVLVGDSDILTPPECAEELAGAISGAQLTVVPKCGHGSTLEQADTVNRALIEWIR